MSNSQLIPAEAPITFKMGDNDVRMYNNEPIFRLGFIGACLEAPKQTVSSWLDLVKPDEIIQSDIIGLDLGLNGKPYPFVKESGFYKILLRVRSPKAEPFVEWVTRDVIPTIRKTGSYSTTPVVPLPSAFQDRYAIAKDLFSIVGIKGNQLVLALDKLYKHEAGYSLLEVTGTMLEAPEKEQVLTPTQIGQMLEPPMSAKAVNLKLMDMGYQHRIGDQLEPIGDGCIFAVMLDVGKAHSDGTPIRQLKWKSSILKNFR